jgi:hypothetical protein
MARVMTFRVHRASPYRGYGFYLFFAIPETASCVIHVPQESGREKYYPRIFVLALRGLHSLVSEESRYSVLLYGDMSACWRRISGARVCDIHDRRNRCPRSSSTQITIS